MNGSVAAEQNPGLKKGSSPKKGDHPLSSASIHECLSQLPYWKHSGKEITRLFTFKNFYETIAFVNVLAYIANQEDHHPDLEVGYKTCKVRYSSHELGGLSENDFICAAKIDGLF